MQRKPSHIFNNLALEAKQLYQILNKLNPLSN